MSGGKNINDAKRPTSEQILSDAGAALAVAKAKHGLTQQGIAEKLGKQDRKSVADYLAGQSDMGLVGFILAVHDPDLGDEFGNEVLARIKRCLFPIDASAVPDAEAIAGLAALLAEYAERMRDGKRCHTDTACLADRIRSVLPWMHAILADARRIRA